MTQGLSETEAAARLTKDGPNSLAKPKRRRPFKLIFDVLRAPMLALLLAGGVIYLILGNRTEALVLLAFACLSIGITFAQEARSERVLAALRDLTNPQANVVRDGAWRKIDAAGLVVGDMISEGDRVPTDASLIGHVAVDESLLTGEAVPVSKRFDAATPEKTQIYAGTLIVAGDSLATVTATGPRSQIGQIGTSLLQTETPHLQSQLQRLVFWFALVGLAVSLAVVLLDGFLRGGDWLAALLTGISVGTAMLPEEFPMVLTVFMAMGAWRISKVNVLTRRAAAIVTTIALGRRIYDNLRKAMSFILALHVPIAGLALLPLILGTPLLFGPIYIASIEMIIDPVCALVFEAEEDEAGLMTRPPRPIDEPLFSRATVLWSITQGALALGGVVGLYLGALSQHLDADQIRALVFATLVLAIFVLSLVNRRRSALVLRAFGKHNRALGIITLVIASLTAAVISFARPVRLCPARADLVGRPTPDWRGRVGSIARHKGRDRQSKIDLIWISQASYGHS